MARSDEQAAVRRLALRATTALTDSIDWFDDPVQIRDLLFGELPTVVNTYGDVAATLAAEHFETVTALPAVLAPQVAQQQVNTGVVDALSPLFRQQQDIPAAIGKISGLVDLLTLGQGDRTMQESAAARGVRYAWVPRGKTCGFCILKASRGPAYISRETAAAGLVKAQRHENCDCTAEPVASDRDLDRLRRAGYDPDASAATYRLAQENTGSFNASKLAAEIDRINGRT